MPYTHLIMDEREIIAQMRYAGDSLSEIAEQLGRDKGTVSRELNRNSFQNPDGYFAGQAQHQADERRRSGQRSKRLDDSLLLNYVKDQLRQHWSPEQISNRLKKDYPDDAGMRVSHQTIYNWIAEEKHNGGTWHKCLRQSHRKRRKRYGSGNSRGQIPDRVSIDERPQIVEERGRLGDWEGDTVEGKGKSGYLVTHVDRKSRYLVAAKVENKKAETVNQGTYRAFRRIPSSLCRTMTFDNGKEFAKFKDIEEELGFDVYFADPYSSWQRGTNENTNGLLREFFPKGTDIRKVSHQRVAKVVRQLNNRPRKCLEYRTPHETLFGH